MDKLPFSRSKITTLEKEVAESSVEELLHPDKTIGGTNVKGYRHSEGYDDFVLDEVEERIGDPESYDETMEFVENVLRDVNISPVEDVDRPYLVSSEAWEQLAEIYWDYGGRISGIGTHQLDNGPVMEVKEYE